MTLVVLTGAAGNLGRKLGDHLDRRGGYEIRRLDIDPRGDDAIQAADLSVASLDWMRTLEDAQVVVHLAADPRADAEWADLIAPNIDAVLNLYLAAARHGVRRVVLASSVWAMASERGGEDIIAGEPRPGANAYGASKAFAERVARAFAHAHGIDTVAVRIGGCRPGANPRAPVGDAWEDGCWLSNSDFCRGMELAMTADVKGCVVVTLTSDNPGSRWSLTAARDLIGYRPEPAAWGEPGPRSEHKASLLDRLRERIRRA